MKVCSVLYGFCLITANALDVKDVVFVVSTQPNEYHQSLAEELKNEIYDQASSLNHERPVVHFSHSDFMHVGGWTLLPLIPYLVRLHQSNCSWFFFAEDRTRVKLKNLIETLEKYNHNKEIWLGYALQDREPTIIHHFAFFEKPGDLKYPNAASGVAVSSALTRRLVSYWKTRVFSSSEFSIDHMYELALFIWNNNKASTLNHESRFCLEKKEHCATFPLPFKPCGASIPNESIYFAVKTCQKFHKDRIGIVKRTWGQRASIINFFSDVADESIPAISLGIPNTESGHCGKTMAIIKYVADDIVTRPNVKWIVIVDDDTILSVARLRELFTCYDADFPIALGERYGYNVHDTRGYNYITGGGGIVLSRVLLEKIATSQLCECPSISSPDDMLLGVCMAQLGVHVTHSNCFHQARPADYAVDYLKNQPIISFHKHWMIDPISVYQEWFSKADSHRISSTQHTEL